MTSTAAMEAGSASVERLLAAAAATMVKARYCWVMTVAEDGSVNARPKRSTSEYGTFRTWRDVCCESVMRTRTFIGRCLPRDLQLRALSLPSIRPPRTSP